MKVRDSLYQYPGFGDRMATAHLRVYRHEGSTVAVIGELTDNPSTSITNCADTICAQLRDAFGPDVIVIEYYPGSSVPWSSVISPAGTRAVWGPLTYDEAKMLAGEELEIWDETDYTSETLRAEGRSV